MISEEPRSATILMEERRDMDEKPAKSAEKSSGRQALNQRQLKDYPQSLQTAARALWG